MKLTTGQRRGLTIITHHAAHIVTPGTELAAHQITYTIAEQLVVAGYARPIPYDPDAHPTRHGAIVITPTGRKALSQPIPEIPVYMHAIDGLTTKRSSAIPGEDEVIDPTTLDHWWTEQAAEKKAAAADRREEARRMAKRLRAA